MFIQRFFVEGLAHASYLFGADGEAAVVDPKRDVDDYLDAAQRQGMRIVAIFETHPHADFASGHVELAQRSGAVIYVSDKVQAVYPHRGLRHDDNVQVGSLQVRALDTPGHSPDSMSFYIEDTRLPSAEQRAVFTGDALFVGDVGRPDLRDADADPYALAEALFDSLHHVLYQLPHDTTIYPTHGAGSLCGRKIGTAPQSTIGGEKRYNWANQFQTRAQFAQAMVSNLPDRPPYFSYDVGVNLRGARPLSDLQRPTEIDPIAVLAESPDAAVIDIRSADVYGAEHIHGSLNIGIASSMFSTWVGFFVKPDAPIVLIVDQAAAPEQAWLQLARIGFENIAGFSGFDANRLRMTGVKLRESPQLGVYCLEDLQAAGKPILDVRTEGERSEGHIEGSLWIPLPALSQRLNEVPHGPLAVLCGSGYRSSLATSLLERSGFHDVVNVRGGWAAWTNRHQAEPDARDLVCREFTTSLLAA